MSESLGTLSPEDLRRLSELQNQIRKGALTRSEYGWAVVRSSKNGSGRIRPEIIRAAYRMSDWSRSEFIEACPEWSHRSIKQAIPGFGVELN